MEGRTFAVRRRDLSKECMAVYDECEPIPPSPREGGVGHVENYDRILRLVTEGSIGWRWNGNVS